MATRKKIPAARRPRSKSKRPVRFRRRSPKIELFLRKINQEKIRDIGSAAGCDLYASWKKSCCVLDFGLVRPGDLVINPMQGLLVRKEPGGGMMWNPRTGSVYKLNEDAYHAVIDIESGLSELAVANRNGMPLRTAQNLFAKLRRLG